MKTKSTKSTTTTILVASSFSVPSSISNVDDSDVRSVIIIMMILVFHGTVHPGVGPPLGLCV